MNEALNTLLRSAEINGVLSALAPFGNNIRVKIPMSEKFCQSSIEELSLSVRSRNGLMRSGASNVEDVVNIIMGEGGLSSIRNLGKKSISEIKSTLLLHSYNELSDREKREFWISFLEMNGYEEN